jgi:hypothetical protein
MAAESGVGEAVSVVLDNITLIAVTNNALRIGWLDSINKVPHMNYARLEYAMSKICSITEFDLYHILNN